MKTLLAELIYQVIQIMGKDFSEGKLRILTILKCIILG